MPATAERINKTDMPDIPMLLFSMKNKEEQQAYAVERYKAKVIPVDCGHFVHNAIPDEASKEMKDFINNLNK